MVGVLFARVERGIGEPLAGEHADTRTDRSQAPLRELLTAYVAARRAMSPGTRQDYEGYIRRCISDHLKDTPIGRIGPFELDSLYAHLLERGGTCRRREKCGEVPCKHGGGDPLDASTVAKVHTILTAAFAQGVRWGWLRDNPCLRASPPEAVPAEVVPPHVETVVRLLVHVDGLPRTQSLPDFVALLIATGARPAELCALTWGDVDLELGLLHIRGAFSRGDGGVVKSTKTKRTRHADGSAEGGSQATPVDRHPTRGVVGVSRAPRRVASGVADLDVSGVP